MTTDLNLVSQITLIFSGLGLLTLIFRKIPALLKIPEDKTPKEPEIKIILAKIFSKLNDLIQKISPVKNFSYNVFLQKILTKVRILTLKTDSQTHNWIQKLREKTQEKLKKGDDYWEKIKKIKKLK